MRTYGTLTIDPEDDNLHFEVEAHVAIRLDRVFRESRIARDGIFLAGTASNLVDVDWFLQRYPMTVKRKGTRDARAWITKCADVQKALMDEVLSILEGGGHPEDVEMALPPRDYQLRAAHALRKTGRLLCADELGLGKTITALTALASTKAFPAVAVVPPHLCQQWERECKRFLPDLRVHVAKTKTVYPVDCDLLILSYYKTYNWGFHLKGKVKTIIFDEAQELRRGESDKYRGCMMLATDAPYRLGLSATPIYNYGGEFYNVFDVIAPDSLGTWSEFVKAWCLDYFERRKARLADPKAFGAYLREMGLMTRRTRAQVARELPGLVRAVEYVEYDEYTMKEESAGALELAVKVMERSGSNFDIMRASAELSMRARQATGIAKAPAVAAFIRMLIEESGEPVVVFAWHRAVYDYFKKALHDLGLAWHTGTESPTKKQNEIKRFMGGKAKVLLMSLRSGQGVDGLQQVCQRVVIAELDWSPGVIEQCIGRIYRDGQAEPVIAYYLLTNGGSDPVIADVLGVKDSQAKGVREPFGAEDVPAEADPEHVKKLAAAYLKKAGVPIPKPPKKVPVPL
jgi:SNF2 family DNA or RNA helicase